MNKFLIRILSILILILVMSFHSFSQTEDFQIWNAISVDKTLNKKISLQVDQEVRLQDNASKFRDYITILGTQYKINKYLRVAGGYRFTHSTSIENIVGNEHRFFADFILKYKANHFIFGFRGRYQIDYVQFDINRWHTLRNKFSIAYDIPKTSFIPFADYELFYSLNSPVDNSIFRNRYTLGMDYEISKTISVNAFYRLQTQRVYLKMPNNAYILGLGVNISL